VGNNNQSIVLPEKFSKLADLSYNLWFSWSNDAIQLFKMVDPQKWEEVYHNPVRLLLEVDADRWVALEKDKAFTKLYNAVIKAWESYMNDSTWFKQNYANNEQHKIAYFSAEFGYHESLPIYSGGLGILAGDHCKSASDLGLPFVGIGLLYKKGYFNQKFDGVGQQHAEQLNYEFSKLPVKPALDRYGHEIFIGVDLPGRSVYLKIWEVKVGRISVFLMDADIERNSDWDRALTAQLYGGNHETRIAQEVLLGIGGIKSLRALEIHPSAFHINEGHAAFINVERLLELTRSGVSYAAAIEAVKSSTIFTTHTPVPAGHDAFNVELIDHYFHTVYHELNGRDTFINLGINRENYTFNMTHLALNLSGLRNGVSKLHGHVSREMFRHFHGSIPTEEVPIGHITNGVHLETWLAPSLIDLYGKYLPKNWTKKHEDTKMWAAIDNMPDEEYRTVHEQLKIEMIAFARNNIKEHRRRNGFDQAKIDEADTYLSEKALTIGFARRFATYKRATLLFRDLDRLKKIVNHPTKPVQFVFGGKAHPADKPGQELIKEIYRISQLDDFRGKVVLLENYDMNMARHLVTGVDIWLNNPLRPYEASGTSGQKAAMNGVCNFSILDGWWEEGFNDENGWSIDTVDLELDVETQSQQNSINMYEKLENVIMPLYYDQQENWMKHVKSSIKTLAPVYSTQRMVQDYTRDLYIPTIQRGNRFKENNYDLSNKIADYKRFVSENWHHVHIISVDDRMSSATPVPTKRVTATLNYGPIWLQDTVVEIIYYEEKDGAWNPVIVTMGEPERVAYHTYKFSAQVPSHLKHGPHFTVRVRPINPNFATSFELPVVTVN